MMKIEAPSDATSVLSSTSYDLGMTSYAFLSLPMTSSDPPFPPVDSSTSPCRCPWGVYSAGAAAQEVSSEL